MAMSEEERAVQGIKDKGARKKAYYKLQRENAEETGDQATSDKINKKLGKKSEKVTQNNWNRDWEEHGKQRLGAVASIALPEIAGGARAAKAVSGLSKLIPKASEELGSGVRALGSKARALATRAKKPLKAASQGRRALTGGKEIQSEMKNVTPKRGAEFEKSGARKGVKLSPSDKRRGMQMEEHKERRALPRASGKTSGISQSDAKRMSKVEREHGNTYNPKTKKYEPITKAHKEAKRRRTA